MSVVVFCGPSLPESERASHRHFEYRPPASQGDVYAAVQDGARLIGIIDGYFDGVPAVWHKEILWALAEGVAVFGASSMGALRAAELHSFGMQGVGQIFERYRDGHLTDDDDVALLHGPAETGFVALSEPMVNIHATLDRAVAEDVLADQEAQSITEVAKRQFYQERTWKTVIAEAYIQSPGEAIERLTAWLARGMVDQKRVDARLLLNTLDLAVAGGAKRPPISFCFEFTETWANAPWRNTASKSNEEGEAILDELRLRGEEYLRIRQKALLYLLARNEFARSGCEPTHGVVAGVMKTFRSRLGLLRHSDLVQWGHDNDTTEVHFEQLMQATSRLEELERTSDSKLHSFMLDQLRLEDSYRVLRERAWNKARVNGTSAKHRTAVMPPPMLVSWYFGTRLKINVPGNLTDYVTRLGLSGLDQFYELLAGEYALSLSDASMGSLAGSAKSR